MVCASGIGHQNEAAFESISSAVYCLGMITKSRLNFELVLSGRESRPYWPANPCTLGMGHLRCPANFCSGVRRDEQTIADGKHRCAAGNRNLVVANDRDQY